MQSLQALSAVNQNIEVGPLLKYIVSCFPLP